MNKINLFIITGFLFIHLNAYAGQQSTYPISINASGSSASGTLRDTYNDSSSSSYFYCGVNSGAILCLGQDAEGDGFGCYVGSSSSNYGFMKDIILSMTPTDRFYINSSSSVCTSINIYKDSKYSG